MNISRTITLTGIVLMNLFQQQVFSMEGQRHTGNISANATKSQPARVRSARVAELEDGGRNRKMRKIVATALKNGSRGGVYTVFAAGVALTALAVANSNSMLLTPSECVHAGSLLTTAVSVVVGGLVALGSAARDYFSGQNPEIIDNDSNDDNGEFPRASAEVMANRHIVIPRNSLR